jgi:hypothetical protein
VLKQLGAARRETILTLARILEGKAAGGRPGKVEQRNLVHHLLELARAQLEDDPQDEQIIALHDQYADIGFAEDQELDRELARGMVAQMFGVELEDHELGGSVEDAGCRCRHGPAGRRGAGAARRRAGRWRGVGHGQGRGVRAGRKEASQSARGLRKLASALHPDRAGDEAERVRRHELMQRVNHAYDEGDLVTCSRCNSRPSRSTPRTWRGCVHGAPRALQQVLREQVRELEQELAGITVHFGRSGQSPANVTRPRCNTG